MPDDDNGVYYDRKHERVTSAREQEIAKLYMKALQHTSIVICSVCPLHDVNYSELGLSMTYDDDFVSGLEALALKMGGVPPEGDTDETTEAEGVPAREPSGSEQDEQEDGDVPPEP